MSMLEIMRFLAEHEGEKFTREDICKHLYMHPGTLSARVQRIRRHWLYAAYFRSSFTIDTQGWKIVQHSVRRGTREELFKKETP